MCDLTDTDRQIFIGMHSVCIDHHMMRAVHRTEHKGFSFHFHSREHILLVVIPVTGCLIQIDCSDTWCHNMQITKLSFFFFDIIFKLLPDRISLW